VKGVSISREGGGPDKELSFAVLQLRNDIDDLGNAIANLPLRLSSLDNSMDDVRQTLRQVESRSTEVEAASNDLAAVVKRLDARVEWLERNIRLQADVSEAQLDDFDRMESELARIAEAGNVARSELLAPGGRSALESAVTAHSDAVRAQVHHRSAALAACEVLAETSRQDERHVSAVVEFRAAVDKLSDSRKRADDLHAPAMEAADVLATDEEQQLAVADVVTEGEQAWAQLQHSLRTRVAEAVGAGALLPSWFTTVLGPIPPAEDTRAWMDVATSLLAYRVTYAVTDPVVALGKAPSDAENARRRAWYQQLRRQCHELQR
jgi:chromosome segregation ATPase